MSSDDDMLDVSPTLEDEVQSDPGSDNLFSDGSGSMKRSKSAEELLATVVKEQVVYVQELPNKSFPEPNFAALTPTDALGSGQITQGSQTTTESQVEEIQTKTEDLRTEESSSMMDSQTLSNSSPPTVDENSNKRDLSSVKFEVTGDEANFIMSEKGYMVSAPDTSKFGKYYHIALEKLLAVHRQFAETEGNGRLIYFSSDVKERKIFDVQRVSKEIYDELTVALFYDSNIRFKTPQRTIPVGNLQPAKVPSVSSQESQGFEEDEVPDTCSCKSIHNSIFNCAKRESHLRFCRNMLEGGPLRTPVASRLGSRDSSPAPNRARRTLLPSPGSGRQSPVWGHRLGYKREPPRQRQMDEARVRSALLAEAHRKLDTGEVPRATRPTEVVQTFTRSTTKAMTKTTSETVTTASGGGPKLSVASGTSSTPMAPTWKEPKQHGESALGPDGQIDWQARPKRPANLPPDLEMRVSVEGGRWTVFYVEKN